MQQQCMNLMPYVCLQLNPLLRKKLNLYLSCFFRRFSLFRNGLDHSIRCWAYCWSSVRCFAQVKMGEEAI